jgi:hypothetical protein
MILRGETMHVPICPLPLLFALHTHVVSSHSQEIWQVRPRGVRHVALIAELHTHAHHQLFSLIE